MRLKIQSLELATALLLTVVILGFHLTRVFKAGGLWRDEAAAVQLATMPSVKDVIHYFPHEAFPLLFPAVLRVYSAVTGNADFAWRIFGFVVGVGIVGVLWWNMWKIRRGVPLLSLALLGFNAAFLQWADSIRGYGLGILLILLTAGLIWHLLEDTTPRKFLAATCAAVASVQCLLHNAILLLAICAGAMAVAFARRVAGGKSKQTVRKAPPIVSDRFFAEPLLVILSVGIIAALSLVLEIGPLSSAREWDVVIRLPVGFEHLCKRISETLSASVSWYTWVWVILTFTIFVACLAGQFWQSSPRFERDQRAVLLFAGTGLLVVIVVYFAFLLMLSYWTEPWYYLALMALVALLVDLASDALPRDLWLRYARLGLALVLALVALVPTWRKACLRVTDIDLAAARLNQSVGKDDLVLIAPWYAGISFERYYHGPARWETIPPLAFHRFHRYDLLKEHMLAPDQAEPVRPLQDLMRDTLRSGHRVWVAGLRKLPPPGITPPELSPAPDPKFGWENERYSSAWVVRAIAYLQVCAAHNEEIALTPAGAVIPFEEMPLRVFDGWAGL